MEKTIATETKYVGWWWNCLDCGGPNPPGKASVVKVNGVHVGHVHLECNPQKAVKK